jgi:hypothetical protein
VGWNWWGYSTESPQISVLPYFLDINDDLDDPEDLPAVLVWSFKTCDDYVWVALDES